MVIPAPSATAQRRPSSRRWRLGAIGGLVVAVIASYGVVTAIGASAATGYS